MSLSLAESLGSLAAAQALFVIPPLGESYAGKSAAGVAGLVMMLAGGLDARLARRAALADRLEALLGLPPAPDPAEGPDARMDRLLHALAERLPLAEAGDPMLAAACLDWLVDWADSERLELPAAG